MCGIAGQVRTDGRAVERGLLDAMCARLEHRGPDSRGIHLEGPAGLGIQRLRVIDLETGDQPIYNEDGSVAIVLNGEIYNFRELRQRLQRRGHRFSTKGDTEVIVHLYEDLGPSCVRELHGMFAFALWDTRRRRLLIARDRVGKKPLFYAHRDGALSFASELAALIEDPELPRDVDFQALDCYLAYQYVPAPMSAFRAVRKLPPASTLTYEDGHLSIERYWRLRYDEKRPVEDEAALHEELREHIRSAVRRRMISDVPLGAFLSGGIDSAAVVAAMAEASPQPVKTFSIGFPDERFSELPGARLIAERFSTDHHELVVEPDALAIIPEIVRHYGEPYGDTSAVPSFYVARMTRRQVTVALNGDGGDESFAGYYRYVTAARSRRFAKLPTPLRRAIAAVAERSPEHGRASRPANRIRRLARSLALDDCGRFRRLVSNFDDRDRERLYTPEFKELVGGSLAPQVIAAPWASTTGEAVVDRMLEVDVRTCLPGQLLSKMDIATMASSLEARSPLLDHELMEFAASLPASLKLRGSEKKIVLREALRGWIPDPILDGPKRGFAMPMVGDWLRTELRDHMRDVLTDSVATARSYFKEAEIRALLDDHLSGVADNGSCLWVLMMLELWHREFIDRPPQPSVHGSA